MSGCCPCPESLRRWHELNAEYTRWQDAVTLSHSPSVAEVEEIEAADQAWGRRLLAAWESAPLTDRFRYDCKTFKKEVWNEMVKNWRRKRGA